MEKTIERKSFPFENKIWKLEFNPNNGIGIETRDEDNLIVHFTMMDLNSLAVVAEYSMEDAWWWKLAGINQNAAAYQKFKTPDSLEELAVMVLDFSNGNVLFDRDGCSFLYLNENGVIVLDSEDKKKKQFNFQGEEIENNIQADANNTVNYPFQYFEGDTHFTDVAEFLQKNRKVAPVKLIEYTENEVGIIISYYLYGEDKTLLQYLEIFDLEGKLLMTEKIGDRLSGIGVDSFLIYNKKIISIKNKRELTVYEVT